MTETVENTELRAVEDNSANEVEISRFTINHVGKAAKIIGKLLNNEDVSAALGEFIAQGQREAAITAAFQEAEGDRKEEIGENLLMQRRYSQQVQSRFFMTLATVGLEELPDQLFDFLGSLVGMDGEEFAEQDADYMPDVIDAVVESPGFGSFLASVSKLAKKVSGKFNSLSSAISGTQEESSTKPKSQKSRKRSSS